MDELERHDLEPLDAFKDLGVVLSPELKYHDQIDAVVKEVRNTAFLIGGGCSVTYPRKYS